MSQENPRRDGPPQTCFSGKVFRVTQEPIRYPSGRRSTCDVVRHLGGVGILPVLLDPLRVVLLHQYRHPVGQRIWEIPAGTLDVEGETPVACAQRELIEETGYRAERMVRVHDFYTAPGFCDEKMILFAAWGLTRAAMAAADDAEVITIHELDWPEALAMLRDGQIQDGKTLVALRWLQEALRAASSR